MTNFYRKSARLPQATSCGERQELILQVTCPTVKVGVPDDCRDPSLTFYFWLVHKTGLTVIPAYAVLHTDTFRSVIRSE